MITPEFFSELIRRGVIYYAGNFLPQNILFELIMQFCITLCGWTSVLGGKKITPKNQIIKELISNGAISELPHKIVFELIG